MVTMAQRIELLRTEVGMSRPAISLALGLPKLAFERFETGRQTPTKEQQETIANYFGVSLFYLRGESNDRTRQDNWMDGAPLEQEPIYRPTPVAPKKAKATPEPIQGSMIDALFAGKQAQDQLKAIMLEVLKSPEGQAIVNKAVEQALNKTQK